MEASPIPTPKAYIIERDDLENVISLSHGSNSVKEILVFHKTKINSVRSAYLPVSGFLL